jgi:hypothetical protein
MAVIEYLKNKALVNSTFKNGESKTEILDEENFDAASKEVEDGASEDYTGLELVALQPYTMYEVGEDDPLGDLANLVSDKSVLSQLVNRAITLKQQQYIRKQMLAKTFVAVADPIDLRVVVGAPSERTSKSPEEKLQAQMSLAVGFNVDAAQLAQAIALIRQGQAQQAGTTLGG